MHTMAIFHQLLKHIISQVWDSKINILGLAHSDSQPFGHCRPHYFTIIFALTLGSANLAYIDCVTKNQVSYNYQQEYNTSKMS